MVHVGAVDAPVSVGDVTQIAAEFKRAIGTGKDAPMTNGVDVLGWDFAFELNEVAKQQAAAANIQMRFLRIPRDVMDKRAVEQGDTHFSSWARSRSRSRRTSVTSQLPLAASAKSRLRTGLGNSFRVIQNNAQIDQSAARPSMWSTMPRAASSARTCAAASRAVSLSRPMMSSGASGSSYS
jgi:hypothetical protein